MYMKKIIEGAFKIILPNFEINLKNNIWYVLIPKYCTRQSKIEGIRYFEIRVLVKVS